MKNALVSLLLAGLAVSTAAPPAVSPAKTLGNAGAPIRIEVFSDFQCPSCKALYEDSLKPLMADYVSKGKVFLVHRDFPLQAHPHARQAAAYANAAARVNKYELVTAELFRQQTTWAANGKVDTVVAGILNPEDMKKVRALITDKSILAETEADIALGTQARVNQTPTMIVTHKGRSAPVAGFITYPILRRYLDQLLSM
jgi:protein-disulfide isomerase